MLPFRPPIKQGGPAPPGASTQSGPLLIFIDADACPVKDEVYKVAARHGLKTYVVANAWINAPRSPDIERVVVPSGADVADDWIAERCGPGSVVVTSDIPLASRAVKAGATVIAGNGRLFSEASIGMALATRNLMDQLRSSGEVTGGPRAFSPRDRSAFLSALDLAVVRLKRAGHKPGDFVAPSPSEESQPADDAQAASATHSDD